MGVMGTADGILSVVRELDRTETELFTEHHVIMTKLKIRKFECGEEVGRQ